LLGIFSAISFIFGIIFAAAESLTREAFPEKIQLWKIWSKKGATSMQVLGRTIGGYLILGFDFAFIISIYYFASRYFGWWTPSSTLIDPNIIATYAPWLGAVGQSLSAGFMEECLFRAVPLAGAALIGKRYGNAKAWIFTAFILQAIIFGAAHANYPSQPAYARLVELIIPSFVFGGIYLAFGLLPAIISHFTYDVVWFSLPIFLSSVNDMWLSQCLVILLTLIPIWIVLFARLHSGYWSEISRNLYNKAWQPKEKPIFEPIIKQPVEFITEKLRYRNWLFIAGTTGLIVWLCTTPFAHNGINLKIDKQTAKTEANETLAQKNIILSDPWQQSAFVQAQINEQHKFLWRTNQYLHKKLLGNYLMPAQWQIRYAQFEGNIVERAEEYNVFVNPDGSVVRISHQLPESKTGQSLSESEARTLAYKTIKNQFGLEAKQLIEISAVSYKRPERLDWVFTFKDPIAYPKETDSDEYGEARINIEIAGNTLADYYRYIFVPEEWKRVEKQNQTVFSILMSICLLILAILFISCGLRAINQWIHHQFAQKTFFIIFFLLLGKSVIQFWNLFPIFIATFKTSEPYNNQLITFAGSLFIRVLFTSLGLALIFGFIKTATFFLQRIRDIYERILFGGIAGIIISGFIALAEKLSPSLSPLWPNYLHASARFPSISFALTHFTTYITTALTFYLLFKTLDYLSQSWSKNLWQTTVLSLILGIAYKGSTGIEHINTWLLFGSLFGVVLLELYIHLIRFDRTIIPYLAAVISILEIIQETVFGAYHGIYLGTLFAIIMIGTFSIWWSEQLYQTKE
ncbi:MAG: CPBP family intramembrane glutamic endopeptidase, partial [Candidatus Babeliales bacterium]